MAVGALFLCAVLAGASALSATAEAPALPKTQSAQQAPEEASYIVQQLKNVQRPGIQMYVADVSVGTPPQHMSVSFETAINISYVPSQSCQGPNCLQRNRYNSSASSTYKADGAPFILSYGGNTTGFLSQDVLGFAGITLAQQTFGEATHMLSEWQQYLPNDGAFGLGYSGHLLDDLKTQGLISEKVAGLYFGRDSEDGELTFGGVNEARYTGELQYLDVDPEEGFWSFHVDGVAMQGSSDVAMCGSEGCSAVPVTSTPYFITSMEQAQSINQALGGKPLASPGAYYFDCTALCDKPSVTVTLAGREITFTALEYTLVSNFPGGMQMCISGFLGSPYFTSNEWGFGTLFMSKVFTVLDAENGRVGFADSV